MSESMGDMGSNGEHVGELLSAYMDSSLDKSEHERVRIHLDACALCRADHVELRATRQLLRSMPVVVPPRAFTLTEEMAAAATSTPRWIGLFERLLSPRNTPRFAMGSVLSFALLLFVLLGNVLGASRVSVTSLASVPQAAPPAGFREDQPSSKYSQFAPTAKRTPNRTSDSSRTGKGVERGG